MPRRAAASNVGGEVAAAQELDAQCSLGCGTGCFLWLLTLMLTHAIAASPSSRVDCRITQDDAALREMRAELRDLRIDVRAHSTATAALAREAASNTRAVLRRLDAHWERLVFIQHSLALARASKSTAIHVAYDAAMTASTSEDPIANNISTIRQ